MFSHGYPPTVSGVTLVVQKLSRALVRSGHTVLVVTASEKGRPYQEEDKGVWLQRIRGLHNPYWSEGPLPATSVRSLREIITNFEPDVIHNHENAGLSVQLLRATRRLEIPKVVSCYFIPPYITQYIKLGRMNAGLEALLWKYAVWNFNHYDQAIFSTPTQQQAFIEHGLKVPSRAISNGVDTRRYHPLNGHQEDVERRYRLPPRPRVLFVGRLMKDKKIDVLIQAMAHVCREQEAHLLVVGRGDDRPRLEGLIAELKLQRNVHLLGFVPEADLPALYRASDLFAIASVTEVQSIPALQAAATGLPIVAADAAALPEIVKDELNGCLAPPDDPAALGQAILHVIKNPERSRAFSAASLQLSQVHAERRTFQAFEEMYRHLAGQSS